MSERVHFRLIQTPCCGQLLCWVNPRLPNYCPECSKPIYRLLRFDGSQILVSDEDAWLHARAIPRSEQPASPAAADYTEQAREIVRKYIKLGVKFVVGPNVYAEWMKNDIADALSAVASAAAIRAFGKGVWSDTEEVAYQAGVSDTREKLQEAKVREAAIEALRKARWPRAAAKRMLEPLDGMAPGIRELYEREVGAIIARIAEMLK